MRPSQPETQKARCRTRIDTSPWKTQQSRERATHALAGHTATQVACHQCHPTLIDIWLPAPCPTRYQGHHKNQSAAGSPPPNAAFVIEHTQRASRASIACVIFACLPERPMRSLGIERNHVVLSRRTRPGNVQDRTLSSFSQAYKQSQSGCWRLRAASNPSLHMQRLSANHSYSAYASSYRSICSKQAAFIREKSV